MRMLKVKISDIRRERIEPTSEVVKLTAVLTDIARAVEEQIRRALDNLAPFLFRRRQNEVVVHHQRCNRRIFHQLVVHLAQNAAADDSSTCTQEISCGRII